MEKELKDKLYDHINIQSKFYAQKEQKIFEKYNFKEKSIYLRTERFNNKSIQIPKKLASTSPHQSSAGDSSECLLNISKRRNGLTSNNFRISNKREELKQIIGKNDFSYSLLNKLKSFKEYENIKKSYLDFEEANGGKINANLFDHTLFNSNEKLNFGKKIKNLSALHRKPEKREKSRNIFLLTSKEKKEKKSYTNTSISNIMSDKSFSKYSAQLEYFKKEEGKIEIMRKKIYKIFEENYYSSLSVKNSSDAPENDDLVIKIKKQRK